MAITTPPQINSSRRSRTFFIYTPEETLGNARITLRMNHDWKTGAEGKTATATYHGLPEATRRFLGSAEGLFRFGQLLEKVPKASNAALQAIGLPPSGPLDTCARNSARAWTWLTTIPHAIEMTPETCNTFQEAKEALYDPTLTEAQVQYKFKKAVRETTSCAGMWGYSVSNIASLFPRWNRLSATALLVGDSACLAADMTNLEMNVKNIGRAYSLINSADFQRRLLLCKKPLKGQQHATCGRLQKI